MAYKSVVFLMAFVLIFFCTHAGAGTGSKAESAVWEPVTPGPFTTLTAPLVKKNKFVAQPLYFFNIVRGLFDGDGHYESFSSGEYRYEQQIQLYMQYGVSERIEINAQPSWYIRNIKIDDRSAEASGFGDFLMNVRYCGIDESAWCPRITGLFQVKLPTGKYQKLDEDKLGGDIFGTGSTDYSYGFSFTKGIKPVVWHLDLLYTNIPSPVRIDGVKTQYSDIYTVNGAFEWIFYKKLNLLGELLWQTQGDTKLDGDWTPSTSKSSLIMSIGIGYSEKNWQMLVGYQRTLLGENVYANDTVAGTVIIIF